MKKGFFSMMCFAIIALFIQSCNKESKTIDSKSQEEINNPVGYYTKIFLTDHTFYKFITSASKNSLKMAKFIKGKESNHTESIYSAADSAYVYSLNATSATDLYFMYQAYPNFDLLTTLQQETIVRNVCNTVASPEYRLANPNNPLIIYEQETIPTLLEQNGTAVIESFDFEHISSVEFWTCTGGLGIALLADYGGIAKDLATLAQGAAHINFNFIFNLACNIIKTAVPWFKVAAMALGYGLCLWSAGQS